MSSVEKTKGDIMISEPSRIKSFFLFLYKAFKRFEQDEIFKEAAALTYMTLLGSVPFLMLVFFILPDLPGFDLKSYLSELLVSVMLPDSAAKGGAYLTKLLNQNVPSNIFNVALLTLTSFGLFRFISGSFDRILTVDKGDKDGIFVKFGKFLMMIFFGFLFTIIILSSTSVAVLSQLLHLPIISNVSFIVIPFLIFFIINAFIYFFATSVKIKFRSLITGTLIASGIWSIAKLGFDFYIVNLTNINLVYGVIATIPIILFWIYLNWIIIIFGVELIAFYERNSSVTNKERDKKTNGETIDETRSN